MHHALCDGGIEGGMGNRVRDLSKDNGVNVSSITYFVLLLQEDEKVDVRQTTLLKLYGKDQAFNISKQTIRIQRTII